MVHTALGRLALPIVATCLLAACGGGGAAEAAPAFTGTSGDFSKSVLVAGTSRSFLLHVPASYSSTTPSPVVLLLHGGQGQASTISNITGPGGFSGTADAKGFIAVYPDSLNGTWDDGRDTIPVRSNDVAFVAALLDALAKEYNVDAKRVHVVGISNGGMMAHRLACELSSRIASVAAVAGNLPAPLVGTCAPSRAVPVAMFSGTTDPLMPYGGGTVAGKVGGTVLSAPATAQFWAQKNSVATVPSTRAVPDADPSDGTTTDLLDYGSAGSAGEVALYRIKGGGHTWPGGTQYLPVFLIGKVARDFPGNEFVWGFFQQHPLP